MYMYIYSRYMYPNSLQLRLVELKSCWRKIVMKYIFGFLCPAVSVLMFNTCVATVLYLYLARVPAGKSIVSLVCVHVHEHMYSTST